MKLSSGFVLVLLLAAGMAVAQNRTTLPYQGHLTDGKGNPIRSSTLIQFTLCSGGDPADPSACGGGTVAYSEMANITPDSNGLFTYLMGTGHAPPDLSLGIFSPIQPLYLEVSIGTEVLLPRKLVVLSQDTAASASYSLDSLAATGAAGLATTGPINTGTQYNIGGDRVLSVPGDRNTFLGVGSGLANTTGLANAFFGTDAGLANTTGIQNAFFGARAGLNNTTGARNAFFGAGAGFANITGLSNAFFGAAAGAFNTTGVRNAFFGTGAGQRNTTGGSNAFFGRQAGLSNTTEDRNTFLGASSNGVAGITNATAIGANAVVAQSDALVLGASNINVAIGASAPKAKLDVEGGNVLVGAPGAGIILKSPNGAMCRLLSIDNAGAMVLAPIACP